MLKLDTKNHNHDLDIVYSVIIDCATKNISFWKLIFIINLALKNGYPGVKFKFVVEEK